MGTLSRRDQVQSYQFMSQRVVSALLMQDTDPPRPPFPGVAGAVFASFMVAVIAVAGVLVYGVFVRGGKTSWQSTEAVVVERETGARFVYRDGVLYPVANLTSARLLGAARRVDVAGRSIAGVPRGPMIGIPGAPETVPAPGALSPGAWQLCAGTASVLFVAHAPAGGTPLGERGVLAKAGEAGPVYLLWHDRRYRLDPPDLVRAAFTWQDEAPVPVGEAWLDAVPAGLDIGPLRHPDFGKPSALAGQVAGRVVVVRSDGGTQHYVAMTDGLALVTPLQAALLLADGALNREPPLTIPASLVRASRTALLPDRSATAWPESVPELARDPGGTVCASFASGAAAPVLTHGADVRLAGLPRRTPGQAPAGTVLADYVVVSPAGGALVRSDRPAAGSVATLVVEPGIAYPVGPAALELLGLAGAPVVRLPDTLVGRVPLGPALDPEAARRLAGG
ncbi:type VII secretion protein EccB [Dactylosporangium sp. AC04546]|uniref:type VII secretion protein EccB n=1 Tax=Dactylosporangium sp. AC04546 TaxID=2862460 RepID=UPI001EE0D8D3|nr:type VII secretion protein EccB [Dactylosporangium sp. AC04546]WVK89095.1 type VII secretion protein EccB [Dactylosporangium sp. AC04546]